MKRIDILLIVLAAALVITLSFMAFHIWAQTRQITDLNKRIADLETIAEHQQSQKTQRIYNLYYEPGN